MRERLERKLYLPKHWGQKAEKGVETLTSVRNRRKNQRCSLEGREKEARSWGTLEEWESSVALGSLLKEKNMWQPKPVTGRWGRVPKGTQEEWTQDQRRQRILKTRALLEREEEERIRLKAIKEIKKSYWTDISPNSWSCGERQDIKHTSDRDKIERGCLGWWRY